MAAFTYIVECVDGTLYVGWTTDLSRRVAQHNAGSGCRYTRSRRPVKLVYWQEHCGSTEARRHELKLKRLRRAAKLLLIARHKH